MNPQQQDTYTNNTHTSTRSTYADTGDVIYTDNPAIRALVLLIVIALAIFIVYLITRPQTLNGLNLNSTQSSTPSSVSSISSRPVISSSSSSIPVSFP